RSMLQAASAARTAVRACWAEVRSAGSSVCTVAPSAPVAWPASGCCAGGRSAMASAPSGLRGLVGLPPRGEPGVVVAAATQAEPAGGFGDRPAEGPGAVIGCGVDAVAELAGKSTGEAGEARVA